MIQPLWPHCATGARHATARGLAGFASEVLPHAPDSQPRSPTSPERTARAADLQVSLCAVLMAEACNTGLEPLMIRDDAPALKRDRLSWVDQNYIRDDTLAQANATLVAAQK